MALFSEAVYAALARLAARRPTIGAVQSIAVVVVISIRAVFFSPIRSLTIWNVSGQCLSPTLPVDTSLLLDRYTEHLPGLTPTSCVV